MAKKSSPLIRMSWSDRSEGQRYPYIIFFSAKQFELSKVAKDNQILRTSKVNNCMIFTNCSAQIFSHFGRIKSNFFSEGNSTDFHLIVISRSLFFFDLIFELFKSRTGFHFRFSNFCPLPTAIIITFKPVYFSTLDR